MELISSSEVPKCYSSYHHSAPTSPKICSIGNDTAFYTAPSSPAANCGNDHFSSSGSDDFEFGTSQRFENYIELEIGKDFECFVDGVSQQQRLFKAKRERGGSLPTIAFADELFHNGLVMPLKPPPGRFQWLDDDASFCRGSIPSSSPTRSPHASVFKVPFVHKAAWNDDFDPFKAALDKVSEESRPSRGRDAVVGSHHRRARSHSPYRTNNSMDSNLDEQILGPKFGLLPVEPKGSPYARFVIDQKRRVEQSTKSRHKKFLFAKMVRPFKTDHHKGKNNSNKISSKIAEHGDQGLSTSLVVETGARKIRNILLKYASFGRSSTHWKPSFKRFSFKIKGAADSDQSDKKRTDHQESKMEIIEYNRSKPSLALCSHGFEIEKAIREEI
ncbi:OLC1v1005247C1 [Oldenlandia corymbosa var. corymbosa]|uniref:OLC1v1005247C1 n=1 Tax=Oldenlandia corymbosa var. corymbosa TaxID=529605 RepID=A0AAV1DHL6_OLDCO|nr:OLC1v1005247C1 [Oldenlandia corymbosa var. corymbosa]